MKTWIIKAGNSLKSNKIRLLLVVALVVLSVPLFTAYKTAGKTASAPQPVNPEPAITTEPEQKVAGATAPTASEPAPQTSPAKPPQSQTAAKKTTAVPAAQPAATTPAPQPAPQPKADPCASVTPNNHAVFPVKVSGVNAITIPAGCTGHYTIQTTDNRTVKWWTMYGGFKFADGTFSEKAGADSPVIIPLNFNGYGYDATNISYDVIVKADATPGQYEFSFYVEDATGVTAGFAFSVRLTITAPN